MIPDFDHAPVRRLFDVCDAEILLSLGTGSTTRLISATEPLPRFSIRHPL